MGRFPIAPGTLGSILGLFWFLLLISGHSSFFYFFGLVLGVGLSIVVTGSAEDFLGEKDPGSIVLDEIVAVPVCFASWVIVLCLQKGHWPSVESFFQSEKWLVTVGVVAMFRVFDVFKPWPVRQAQHLSGGFGVTLDDALAALYVNVSFWPVYLIMPNWFL